jgi:hypothetical protein
MLLVSTGFKASLFGPKSFAQIFAGGQIRIYNSVRPASANNAETAVPFAIVQALGSSGPGLTFALAAGNNIKPPATPWALVASAPGTAVWWRLVGASDTGADSLTAPRIDGDIGTTAAPADMTLATDVFTPGNMLPIDSFLYTIPPL